MTAPDLLPCPFCGGTDLEALANVIDCACGASGPHEDYRSELYADPAHAIAAWNTRATPAATDPKAKALVEAAEDYLDADPDTVKGNEALGRLHAALAALREGGAP